MGKRVRCSIERQTALFLIGTPPYQDERAAAQLVAIVEELNAEEGRLAIPTHRLQRRVYHHYSRLPHDPDLASIHTSAENERSMAVIL